MQGAGSGHLKRVFVLATPRIEGENKDQARFRDPFNTPVHRLRVTSGTDCLRSAHKTGTVPQVLVWPRFDRSAQAMILWCLHQPNPHFSQDQIGLSCEEKRSVPACLSAFRTRQAKHL